MEMPVPRFLLRSTLLLLFVVLVFFILIWAQPLLIPFTAAGLFAFLLLPLSLRLEKLRIPRALSIIISILLAIALLTLLVYFFYSQIITFKEDIPLLRENLDKKLSYVQEAIRKTTQISEEKQVQFVRQRLNHTMESGTSFLMGFFSATGTFLALVLLIPIYIFFMLYYREKFKQFILINSEEKNHPQIIHIIKQISTVTQKYLTGILIDISILSVLTSLGLYFLGIKHALLLGILAAILNIIPYVGVLIGSALPIIMALLTKDSIWYAVGAGGVCWVVQLLDNNFITPKVVGSSVSLNPLSTLVILIIGGMVWGIAGMMMFIPLLGMTKVVFDHVESLRPYAFLIGEEKRMNDDQNKNGR